MNTKKIGLIVMLLVIAGAIWYLEGIKAQPNAEGSATPQAISVDATSTAPAPIVDVASGTAPALASNATGTRPTSIVKALPTSLQMLAASDKKAGYHPAIEISGPTGFINAPANFKLADLIGKKVVLVDFWTYSCINCIRTLPYLTSWYAKYRDQGLVIVGIHTPEFDFEKNIDNVTAATKQYGIQYPVVLDSNQGTWNAYGNLYWPHEYLIDLAGYVVHDHIGEGGYAETENLIQGLLKQRATILGSAVAISTSTVNVTPSDLSGINSPETYFGAARNDLLANGSSLTNGTQVLAEPKVINSNELYLVGGWNFEDQYAQNTTAGAKIIFKYNAAKVNFVANGASAGSNIQIMQDGVVVPTTAAGSDVHNGKATIQESRLYNIIDNHDPHCTAGAACQDVAGEHTLEILINSPGLQAFTFTFG
jgi:thiol-disulfide isomerase/thioredoxin